MARKVRLNSPGIAEVAKSVEVRKAVTELAEEVADNVRGQSVRVEGDTVALPVEVTSYTTDRARSSVTITHPAGLAVQAKHGALTRAAAQAGLEVKGR